LEDRTSITSAALTTALLSMVRKKPALGLDPGVAAGFRKDHAQSKFQSANRFNLKRLRFKRGQRPVRRGAGETFHGRWIGIKI
jgi:hypothetical protein